MKLSPHTKIAQRRGCSKADSLKLRDPISTLVHNEACITSAAGTSIWSTLGSLAKAPKELQGWKGEKEMNENCY